MVGWKGQGVSWLSSLGWHAMGECGPSGHNAIAQPNWSGLIIEMPVISHGGSRLSGPRASGRPDGVAMGASETLSKADSLLSTLCGCLLGSGSLSCCLVEGCCNKESCSLHLLAPHPTHCMSLPRKLLVHLHPAQVPLPQ